MNKTGVIIIIEDDPDDQCLLEDAFCELDLPNERLYFKDGDAVLDYFTYFKGPIFLILSDIRMPRLNGMELQAALRKDADVALRCVPYLFLTTTLNHQQVVDAYSKSSQGFFEKPGDFQQLRELLRIITSYWSNSATVEIFA